MIRWRELVKRPQVMEKMVSRKDCSVFKDGVRCSAENEGEGDRGTGLLEAPSKPSLKKPSFYRVTLLNDDYTPMEFVVEILQAFFGMDREKATQIMLTVHTSGKATCGIFPRDIAETKSAQVNQCAKDNEHPLVSEIEPVADDE